MEDINMIFDKIKDIIIEQLQVEESEISMDTNLMKDLSADSLDAVEIIMAIEDEYDIEVDVKWKWGDRMNILVACEESQAVTNE